MASQGCPLCRLATKAERTFIDSLNYERVLDLKTRDALKASRGLCDQHSRVWQNVQGSALGVAIVIAIYRNRETVFVTDANQLRH